ncbi:DUF4347 domain-containing protein, partial [Azohydromonas lata]|uniref:DUF4347 domain-containing protein n=1 Tax=Azohydromonas lata TaxID=45677 RepID=UPI0012F4FE8C
MNKIHRTVWNEVTRSFVAVAEIVRGRGKGAKSGSNTEISSAPRRIAQSGLRPLALEQRFMFDGAAVAAVVDASHALPDLQARVLMPESPAPVQIRVADVALNGGRKEVAFVDTSVAAYKTLEAGIRAGVEIQELDGNASGLAQIARWAETHGGYDAIHLLSHGASDSLHLGRETISAASLENNTVRAELATLGQSLNAGGDLLLYGCDVAQGAQGQHFIDALHSATGADVTASTDATGAATAGGDWTLEKSTGSIEVAALNAPDYAGVLGVPTAITTVDFDNDTGAVAGNDSSELTQTIGGINFSITGHNDVVQTGSYYGGDRVNTTDCATLGPNAGEDKATFTVATGYVFDLTSLDLMQITSQTGDYVLTAYDANGTAITGSAQTFSNFDDRQTHTLTLDASHVEKFVGISKFTLTFTGDPVSVMVDNIVLVNVRSSVAGTPPTTTISTAAFSADTGSSSTDFLTKTAAQTISGTLSANLATGESVKVSTDGGTTWQTATASAGNTSWSLSGVTLTGSNTLKVKVSNSSGDGSVYAQAYVLDTTPPTVTDARISISGATGTSGAYKIGDTVTATWNNTVAGDNNAGVSGVMFNFTLFGGGSAVSATNSGGVWTATYTLVAGSIDATNRNVAVTVTDNAGNARTTVDTTNAKVDNIAPTVTEAKLSISGATGTGGAYKIGDTVTATWNNTAAGDNNADTISGVTFDFSAFGGGSAVAASNSAGTWTATYTIVAGAIDATGRNVSAMVTDNAGNATTVSDTSNATVDSVAPSVTDAFISISGGTGGAYKVGDTVTATWTNTAAGDNNADTISGVTFDFSAFGGGTAVAASNVNGVWTATYTL